MPPNRSTSLRLGGALALLLLLPGCQEFQAFMTGLAVFVAVIYAIMLAFAAIHYLLLGFGIGLAFLAPFNPPKWTARASLVVAGLNVTWGVLEVVQPHALQPFQTNQSETGAILLSFAVGVMGLVLGAIALLRPEPRK